MTAKKGFGDSQAKFEGGEKKKSFLVIACPGHVRMITNWDHNGFKNPSRHVGMREKVDPSSGCNFYTLGKNHVHAATMDGPFDAHYPSFVAT